MENYQLYRTNVLLGGQMKYDVVLKGSNDTNLYIDSLNITPISDTIPYDRYNKSYWVSNYSFAESIKKFYHQTSGYFYDTNIDPILSQGAPLPEKYTGSTYDDRYEMGCRRMNYSLYNKQLSFFCPIWLEKLDVNNGDYLLFEFSFYSNMEQTKQLCKARLQLKYNSEDRSDHNKYVGSFNEFIKLLGIDNGEDTIINLSQDSNSTLHAFNVSTGKCVSTKTGSADDIKLSNLHDLLTKQQRILLEQNQLIINNLKDNLCIAKQLFNFNFCFNPSDVLPKFVINELKSENVYISIQVYINNDSKNTSTKLELRDFYSNHEYIQRKVVTPKYIVYDVNTDNAYTSNNNIPSLTIEKDEPSEQYNVLSYYNDHRYINTIDKNKILQSIIHWAPVNNRHEILNFYPGFMSCHKIKHPHGEIIESVYNGYNMGTPQLDISSYSRQSNPYWCNTISLLLNMDENLVKKIGEEYAVFANDQFRNGFYDQYEHPDLRPVDGVLNDTQITTLSQNIQNRFEEFVMSSLEDILINAEEKYHYLYSTFSRDCYVRNIHYKDTSLINYFKKVDHINVLFVNIANYLESEDSSNFAINASNHLKEYLIKRYSNLITSTRYFSKYAGSSSNFVTYDAIRYNDYVIILYIGDKPEASTTLGQKKHSNLTEQFAEDLVYNNFINLYVGKMNTSNLGGGAKQVKDFAKNSVISDNSFDIYMSLFHRIINYPVKSDFKYLRINTGLKNIPTVGPSMNIKEIDLLHTNQNSVIYRTLGHISPMFISPDNDLLFNYNYNKFKLKYVIGEDEDTGGAVQNISILPKPAAGSDNINYIKYINNSFPPLYPSIGYFKYYKNKQSYDQPIQDSIGEYHSMNCNKVYFLTEEIQVEIDQSIIDSNKNGLYKENYTDIDELIKKYIIDYYKTGSLKENNNSSSKELEYIVSLYNYTYNLYDVFIDDNGNQVYKYDVKIKLK